jgi:threonine/homoserine efflux transporter RhtA
MVKLLLILLVGLVFESAGIVLLKKGVDQVGELKIFSACEVLRVLKFGITNPQILLGIFFQALFFGCLLYLMSKSDISFLWPLTALSLVFATVAAMIFLHETVTPIRWAGVILIMAGAALISYSEHSKPKPTPPAPLAGTNTSYPPSR